MCIGSSECQTNVIIRLLALIKLRFKIFVFMALVRYLLITVKVLIIRTDGLC